MCIVNEVSYYVLKVEDLLNRTVEEVHGSKFKYYSDSSLDTTSIMSHVISSEIGMLVSRLLKIIQHNGVLKIRVRWKGLSPQDDTEEDLSQVLEDFQVLCQM